MLHIFFENLLTQYIKKKSNMNRNNPLSIQRNEATIKKKIIKAQK